MNDRFGRFAFAISEISRYWHKLAADEMEKYGLKGPCSVYLLLILNYPEGITASMLCEKSGKDKSDISRAMAIMEKKGLVIKESIYQNRYGGVFKLTEEGKTAAEHVRRRTRKATEPAGKDLTEENRKIFYEGLESIAANLKELCKDGLPE
ncbi:MAG: hypothetical protein J6K88_04955 [Oscillospiraceae bacterium]|nr:hypothetical protein [Oscillospiraceae bacterium]